MADRLYEARRDFLIRIHRQVWLAASRALLPLVFLSYAVHAVRHPCWQTYTMLTGAAGMVTAWALGSRWAAQGRLDLAVRVCASSGIGLTLVVLLLREHAAVTSAISLLAVFTYAALFSDRALLLALGISTPLYIAGLLVGHFGLIPQYAVTPQAALVQTVLYTAVFFPIAAYFLRAGQRINEKLYRDSLETDARKLAVLDAVARVQPVLDEAISGLRPMAESFAATATEQAATAAQMGTSADRVAQRVGETATAAQGTRELTERLKDDAARGREQLRGVESAFEAAVQRIESVRTQIDELAAEAAQTEQVNEAIHEITKNLTVMGINASLEAARAGAAGVGFQVVAVELQRLVGQTSADLQQAHQILEHLQARAALIAQDADASTSDLRASYQRLVTVSALLEGITTSFADASRSVEGIADAAEQQRRGIGEISGGIQNLVDVAGTLSEAGHALRERLERVEGAHGQLRDILKVK